MDNRKLFISSLPITAAQISNKQGVKPMLGQVITGATAAYQSASPELKSHINQQAANVAGKVVDKVKRSGNRRGNPNNNDSRPMAYTTSPGYALSEAPEPRPISLNTGIRANTYVESKMDAVYHACSPLHLTGCYFQIPTNPTSKLYDYFIHNIAFDLQSKSQVNVSYNINIQTDFSATNILNAFNALIRALQVYMYYMSIITYHSNPANNNAGMLNLRESMTAQMLEDLVMLERRLLDTPVPPNLLEFLRYLSGNYFSGNTQGSPIIKLAPTTPSSSMIDTNQIAASLVALDSLANNTVFSVMRKATPHWIPRVIYDVPTEPFYDENFKTIWANLPFTSYMGTTMTYGPVVSDSSATVQFNSFSNRLDGAAFCLAGMYNTSTNLYEPGFLTSTITTATSSAGNNRRSYYANSSGLKAFYISDMDQYLTRARPETYKITDDGIGIINVHLAGAELCQNVNSNSTTETAKNVMEYLMSFDTIKVDARNYHHKGGSSNAVRNKRGR